MSAPEPLVQSKTRALVVLGATLTAAFVAIMLLLGLTEDLLEDVADQGGIAAWDRPVLDWMLAHRSAVATAGWALLSDAGGPVGAPIVTALVVGYLCWRWRDATPLVLTGSAVGGSLAMSVFGKKAIGRLRPPLADAVPPHETSFAWPSGHTLNATVIAGVLAYLLVRHLWDHPAWQRALIVVVAGAYAVAMGISRIYLGHHWFTDVLGAWVLGLSWLMLVIALHRVWRTVRHRPW